MERNDAIRAGLTRYYGTSTGYRLQAALDELFADCLNDVTGRHAVILECGDMATDWSSYSSVGSTVGVGPSGKHVRAELEKLPIDAESVSLVIAYHALDFCADANAVMREIHRVLMPEGRLIVVSFNSLRGTPKALKLTKDFTGLTGTDTATMRRLLRDHGFAVRARQYVGAPFSLTIAPPPSPSSVKERCMTAQCKTAWNTAWRPLSRVVITRADKKVVGMTPVRPRFKFRKSVLAGKTAGVSDG